MGVILLLLVGVATGVAATLRYISWDAAIVVVVAAWVLITLLYICGIAGRRHR